MMLAKVVGKIIANEKAAALTGAKLLLIEEVASNGESIQDPKSPSYVAVDTVGAGQNDIVLVHWGYQSNQFQSLTSDMCIVGIVDLIQTDK
ncbi:EutN/CcmL family microcompartment protein [Vagococcus sp.]|uniref:EutN/CcmL family microcompartment protein n=1 Tax=Vagococcus sp. TaxID=1933889 RepID=UPI003F9D6A06